MPPSFPPSPPVGTPVSKQGHAQAFTPTTHTRDGSTAVYGEQPSASGIGIVDAIEELINVEAATEAINAAVDRELQQALEMMRHVEAEGTISACTLVCVYCTIGTIIGRCAFVGAWVLL